jgi:EAL domain-containing protein (putative c-di-GMP-specific phosphodiesterase class I)
MVFQPIVDLLTDKVMAVEALARFDITPYRPPNVWFDEAHQCGLGIELELLAVARALAQLQMLPDSVAMTVNASPRALVDSRFRDAVRDVPAGRVIVELTEHSMVDDYPRLIATSHALRRGGLRLAIDDTGSGYSSLSHILRLAPDVIKLDRDLVSGIDMDPVRRALAASLVAFARDTGAQIVAEGIETADELHVIGRLGVRYGQGYHLGHPAPIEVLVNDHQLPPAADSPLQRTS